MPGPPSASRLMAARRDQPSERHVERPPALGCPRPCRRSRRLRVVGSAALREARTWIAHVATVGDEVDTPLPRVVFAERHDLAMIPLQRHRSPLVVDKQVLSGTQRIASRRTTSLRPPRRTATRRRRSPLEHEMRTVRAKERSVAESASAGHPKPRSPAETGSSAVGENAKRSRYTCRRDCRRGTAGLTLVGHAWRSLRRRRLRARPDCRSTRE